jgi:hypothetical protein
VKIGTVPVGPAFEGFCPSAMAIDEANGFGYVGFGDSPGIAKVNLSTNAVVGVAPFLSGGCDDGVQLAISDLGGGHKHLWVLRTTNTFAVMEITPTLTFAQISGTGSLALPSDGVDMAVDNSVSRVFIACPNSDQIVAFNDSASHGTAIGPSGAPWPVTLTTGSMPSRLAIADTASAPDRLFIAARGGSVAGQILFMNTSSGANSSAAISIPVSPPNNAWDVAFDGDTSTGRIFISVRGSGGTGLVHFDPVGLSMITNLDTSAALGSMIDDLLAFRNTGNTASKIVAVRGPNFGVDGGKSLIANFPYPTGAGSVLGTPFTYPPGVQIETTDNFPGESHQNLAVDGARERAYVVHQQPFHVHVFDTVDGSFDSDLVPSPCEHEGVVAVNRATAKIYAMTCDANMIGVWDSTAAPTTPDDPFPASITFASLTGMGVSPSLNKVVFSHTGNSLLVMDGATHAVTSIGLGSQMFGESGVLVHPTTGFAYVGTGVTGSLKAVNLATGAVVNIPISFPVDECFAGAALDATANRLYIGSEFPVDPMSSSGTMFVVDINPSNGTFNSVINTFVISSGGNTCDFHDMIVDPVNGRVYASDKSSATGVQTLFCITGATGAVFCTLPTGMGNDLLSFAVNPTLSPSRLYYVESGTGGTLLKIHDAGVGTSINSFMIDAGEMDLDADARHYFAVNESTDRAYFIAAPTSPPGAAPVIKVVNASDALETSLAAGPSDPCSTNFIDPHADIEVNPVTGLLFAVTSNTQDLLRYNGITAVASPSLTVTGFFSEEIAVNASSGLTYVVTPDNSSVDVFGFPPSISAFSPTSGASGTSVTISGQGFTAATTVAFNGTGATFTVLSDSSISATVPSGATTGLISVITAGGSTSSSSSFTVSGGAAPPPSAPVVSSFSPSSGPVGTSMSIFGSGFTGATAVTFNGVSASFSVSSDTLIVTSVPTGATTGSIAVTGPGGTGTSSSPFTVTAPPLSIAPGSANPPSANVLAGAMDVPLLQIDIVAGASPVTLSMLSLLTNGTINPATGIPQAPVDIDVNDNGIADAPDTFLVGGVFSSSPSPRFNYTFPSLTIPANSRQTLLFSFDVASGLSVGSTFGVSLPGSSVSASQTPTLFDTVIPKPGDAPGVRWAVVSSISGSALTVAPPATSASASIQGGTSVADFIMFGSSIDTGSTGFQQVESQLGVPGATGGFRLFRFDPSTGQYDEYPSSSFTSKYPTMNPAHGWWLIARNAGALTFTGTSTAVTNPNGFTITPGPGWRQFANPYSAPLPLTMVTVNGTPLPSATGTLPTAYFFQGGSYFAETSALQPKRGYWIKNVTASSVTITFERPPTALKPGEGESAPRSLAPGEEAPPGPPDVAAPALASGGGGGGGGGLCVAGIPGGTGGMALPLFALSALLGAALSVRCR